MAKEIKMDKRLDKFVATPLLGVKKMLFSDANTHEGIGHREGERQSGKFDSVDISRAFFQVDAVRGVYVGLAVEG